ncbi:serpin family protein [Butyrivibrio sp. XPD2002]|uniref:serpin family protein n=1 Tax=Butyrivibrio sp. XPD2002 TaxID=1280665 RepID=UPI0009DC0787|nr:serpin family protein [Butyrivibrio sp. XPD2002]
MMTEILKWLLVVAACGGLVFATFVTIIYLGHKLKEDEEKETSEEAENNADEAKAPESKMEVVKPEPVKPAEEETSDPDEIDMSAIAELAEEPAPKEEEETAGIAFSTGNGELKLSEFDRGLIDFLEDEGYRNENYMVSPASLRAVIGLAVAGADSDTKSELLKAAGFSNEAEMNMWYNAMVNAPDTSADDFAFKMLNSAWHNSKLKGELSPDYKDYIKNHYGAEAQDIAADEITDAVNNWVNEGTDGLIPTIANDLSEKDLVLVNTLYLKSSWIRKFEKEATGEDDFMSYDGCCIKKEFMDKTDHYKFYEDPKSKILVMSLSGDVEMACILGDTEGFQGKLSKASDEKVHVMLPKFETETSFEKKELVHFLQSRGAKSAFAPEADFSAMSSDSGFFVSDIIQKTKIITDENGVEASAATGMAMVGAALDIDENPPKEFFATKPFKYYIMTSGNVKEVLFYGQIVE